MGFTYVPIEISLRERKRNPSLNDKGPSKEEAEIQKVIKRNTAQKNVKKGVARKPGGKARMGKETERAKTIVRNSKQKRAKNK